MQTLTFGLADESDTLEAIAREQEQREAASLERDAAEAAWDDAKRVSPIDHDR